ncbi:MAG: hypothetical protein PVJ57_13905 [Phycisphaerae bacterium]|jgi:hypothetical protein
MPRSLALVAVFLGAAALAHAQSGQNIIWQDSPERAVALARNAKRPILVYVLGSELDRNDRLERDQRRALADPKVVNQARRFVCVKISRVRHKEFLQPFGLRENASLEISFVAPDGEQLGSISGSGVATVDTLTEKLFRVFDFHRQRMFDRELRPVLENKESKPAELRAALKTIREFTINGADATVAALLDRTDLDKKTTADCYNVLSDLSTKISVEKLISLAEEGDAKATAALSKCTPAAAEMMLDQWITPDRIRLDLYQAMGKICRVKSVKNEKWWQNAKDYLKTKEIDRITELVRQAAKTWKDENAYR